MLALSQTRFGASGGFRRVNHFGVSRYGYNLLLDKDFPTDGTVLALSQTRFGTGGCLRGVNHFGVPRHRNDFLLHKNLTTDGTVLALSQPRFGTGGCLRGVDDLLMVTLTRLQFHTVTAGNIATK